MPLSEALIALLLPAIQAAREAGRNSECQHKLHQLSVASHNFESTYGILPFLGPTAPIGGVSYSVHARLLPFLEEDNINRLINFNVSYDDQPFITGQRIAGFLCPSEQNDKPVQETVDRQLWPVSYAFGYGTWFVWNPVTREAGDGVVVVNGQLSARQVADGLSKTLLLSEVQAWTPYYRDGSVPNMFGTAPPSNANELMAYCTGGSLKADPNLGHTEWVDARVLHTGFTTTLTPNTVTGFNGFDIDFVSSREGRSATALTFSAITSRSYHPNHVNVALLDGSVRSVDNTISLTVWRALGTRNGGEVCEIP